MPTAAELIEAVQARLDAERLARDAGTPLRDRYNARLSDAGERRGFR